MDIYIHSEVGTCQEYIDKKGGEKEVVSIIISPLKVQGDESGMNLRVVNGCSMWQACHNSKCFFSAAARTKPKIKA